jgi:beta-ribofuranosylaminobenzene 5'-phosphate synthase
MIRVTAAARLHLGLLSPADEHGGLWPDRRGEPALAGRVFGGAGLMVGEPALRLTVTPGGEWSAEGPLGERALAFARRFATTLPPDAARPCRLVVEQAPPEHVGLGTGTQLGLAVAAALAAVHGISAPVPELAARVGRGLRSGIGAHGFERGGFLVDAGKQGQEAVAPLVARLPVPEAWRLVLAIPPGGEGLHGAAEQEAFRRLPRRPPDLARTDALCRLVLLGMLPALAQGDLGAFGEAVYDFNARAGEAFAFAQGGTYAGAAVKEVVEFVRRQGVRGVGQSSWGPTVFAVVQDEERARDLATCLGRRFGLGADRLRTTAPCNRGAILEEKA